LRACANCTAHLAAALALACCASAHICAGTDCRGSQRSAAHDSPHTLRSMMRGVHAQLAAAPTVVTLTAACNFRRIPPQAAVDLARAPWPPSALSSLGRSDTAANTGIPTPSQRRSCRGFSAYTTNGRGPTRYPPRSHTCAMDSPPSNPSKSDGTSRPTSAPGLARRTHHSASSCGLARLFPTNAWHGKPTAIFASASPGAGLPVGSTHAWSHAGCQVLLCHINLPPHESQFSLRVWNPRANPKDKLHVMPVRRRTVAQWVARSLRAHAYAVCCILDIVYVAPRRKPSHARCRAVVCGVRSRNPN
jgi:hypothetical protein